MADEFKPRLKSFQERRYEPFVWRGGKGTGDELEYLESTGFSSPRKQENEKKARKHR